MPAAPQFKAAGASGSCGAADAPRMAAGLMMALAGTKLALHLALGGRYGYFRDELYFLECGRHLAAGYVDLAPLGAVYARIGLLLGGSLHAIRLIPAVAGAGLVALTMYMTRQLGGGGFAQGLAGLCVLIAPAYLAIDNILSMNAMEPLFWMGCIAVVIAIINRGDSRLWLWFGVLAGLGLENKHSMLFFGLAVTAALLLTEQRREFGKPWLWLAGALALLIFLPNVAWQVRHHYPTLEDLENVRRMGKNVVVGPVEFIGRQILSMHPILFPVWLAGLAWFLREKRWRVLEWTFVVFVVTMFLLHAKDYYLFPIYPMLLAGGAVAIEGWTAQRAAAQQKPLRVGMIVVIAAAGAVIAPIVLPLLAPGRYIAYSEALHVGLPKTEVAHRGPLPQLFGDQFGWPELVKQVADIYWSLPPEVRAQTGIYASNYGEAGAINLFGPKYGLPRALSGHQNYYFWGTQGFTGTNLIWLQWDREEVEQACWSVEEMGVHFHPYGMAEENRPINLCRGLKAPLSEIWPHLKHWN